MEDQARIARSGHDASCLRWSVVVQNIAQSTTVAIVAQNTAVRSGEHGQRFAIATDDDGTHDLRQWLMSFPVSRPRRSNGDYHVTLVDTSVHVRNGDPVVSECSRAKPSSAPIVNRKTSSTESATSATGLPTRISLSSDQSSTDHRQTQPSCEPARKPIPNVIVPTPSWVEPEMKNWGFP